MELMKEDKPVYWDPERQRLYWIEWKETGNNDIPHRHYITTDMEVDLRDRVERLEAIARDKGLL